jgi:diaminohydroxyphosphoribosylaminopyrimidine deaminase/5-amino-6-(5-phosphoribosylamino)uracil reductase
MPVFPCACARPAAGPLQDCRSLDGRTALADGRSQWITAEPARLDVHRLRAQSCAVLTGVGTVLADDPLLNVRGLVRCRQPSAAACGLDSGLRTPPDARCCQ